MSPFFVRFFKSQNPCPSCPAKAPGDKAPGKSLCGPHLLLAKLNFRAWAVARRLKGFCYECSRRALKDAGRCRPHREKNLARVEAFFKRNPNYGMVQAKRTEEQYISKGLCRCRAHLPLVPGSRRCQECKDYQKALSHGDAVTLKRIRTTRLARLRDWQRSRVLEAFAQLKALGIKTGRVPRLAAA